MKLNYENTLKIKNFIKSNNLTLSTSSDFAFDIYKKLQYPNSNMIRSLSVSDRVRVCKKQIDFIQKSLVNIFYEENGEKAKNLSCGYVYAISNPAWDDYIKIGSTIDVFDRLNTYQTSCPNRDFELIDYLFTENRLETEKQILQKFKRKNEWVLGDRDKVVEILCSFKNYPELSILEFCLVGCFSAYYEELKNKKSDKEIIRIFCKNQAKILSKISGIDERTLKSNFNAKSFCYFTKNNGTYMLKDLPVRFTKNSSSLTLS